jgi:predicted permease
MYNVFSPALVFYSLFTSDIGGGEIVTLFILTIVFQLIITAVTFLVLQTQAATPLERAGVMISTFCLNAGNYGLSVVAFAFGDDVLSRAVVIFVANVLVNYSLGVYIATSGRASPRQALLNVFKTPALYALLIAFVMKGLSVDLPVAADRTVGLLSSAAIPLMIILLGLQMGQARQQSKPSLVAIGTGLRLFLSPFLAAGLALIAGLDTFAAIAFILQASMPTAVMTIVLATEFDLDQNLALNIILASTLLSPLTLSVLILILEKAYNLPT